MMHVKLRRNLAIYYFRDLIFQMALLMHYRLLYHFRPYVNTYVLNVEDGSWFTSATSTNWICSLICLGFRLFVADEILLRCQLIQFGP